MNKPSVAAKPMGRAKAPNRRAMAVLTAERQFRALAAKWHRETDIHSSFSTIESHPAYLQIIEMGARALPFILGELRDHAGHWFKALRSITNENPVPKGSDHEGRRKAWLAWGRERGLIG